MNNKNNHYVTLKKHKLCNFFKKNITLSLKIKPQVNILIRISTSLNKDRIVHLSCVDFMKNNIYIINQ